MSDHEPSREHQDLVRRSFSRQVGLFTGPGSPFAVRTEDGLAWLGPVSADDRVVEVACGAAHVAEVLSRHVRFVLGIDLTRTLLDLGAARLAEAGVRNVVLQEGDGERLPFVDGSFDLACCRTSLHHFGDPAAAVAEMTRVLDDGGRLALLDLVVPSTEVRDEFDRVNRLADPAHARTLLVEELAGLVPAALMVTDVSESAVRAPIDVLVTEQSDRDGLVAALRHEIDGGTPTGLAPADDDGTLTVEFRTAVVRAAKV
jgi:SAM-dependent methyltransferase